jgi:chromate transporter
MPVTFTTALRVWFRIGLLSFGGPAGQIALMHRELVEKRRWISETRFLHALNYCMLLPGPEAQQLATYIGWLMHRWRGGLAAGLLFILPGCIVMLALSAMYVAFGEVPLMTGLFLGLKSAVLAIVVEALLRISRRALKHGLQIAIAVAAFLALHLFDVAFPWIIIGAALIGTLASRVLAPAVNQKVAREARDTVIDALQAKGELEHTQPSAPRALFTAAFCLALWLMPVLAVLAWAGAGHILAREGAFFSQTALVTFGGAYAVLTYVAQRVVQDFHWLAPGQMIDGLALAETTPGPLILVLQFVGFVAAYQNAGAIDPWLAAVLGALLTTWVTFVPSFMFIFVGAPFIEALRHRRWLNGALAAITAAVVGVILNLSLWFAAHVCFARVERLDAGWIHLDMPAWPTANYFSIGVAALAMLAVFRFKLALGWVLAGGALLGIGYQLLAGGATN